MLCGSFLDYIHETNFWMSSGGTRSVIHYDADHNLHCLVSGRKDFIMIERKYAEDLYFFEMVYGNNIIERLNKNFILKEADNKIEALPRASKTIFEVGQCMQKKN